MSLTMVTMKDGRQFTSPIWVFRAEEGYLTLVDHPLPLYFRDMLRCVTPSSEVSTNGLAERDELARAKAEGWDGR
jgi:hypothetical protein